MSAFGATDNPTTTNDAEIETMAENLANFVKDNHFDGVDLDYEDSASMQNGNGVTFLVSLTQKLRAKLPGYIITHAPQGPYFNAAYHFIEVDQQVGNLIDFYNVQFYNQGSGYEYETYDGLFKNAYTTSVKEIIDQGVPAEKVVVGKPATPADISGAGYVSMADLANWTVMAFNEFNWSAGLMFWQYSSDLTGNLMK